MLNPGGQSRLAKIAVTNKFLMFRETWAELAHFNFFCQEQAAFRKGFRTTNNIFISLTVINKFLSRNEGRLYIAFMDFRKAFDSISHQLIVTKLKDVGITCNILEVLSSMYMQLNAHVKKLQME